MPTNVRDVSGPEFADQVVERSRQVPVVVDFWAAWCGPCRVLGPILERAAAEALGAWELVKVDVDQNQALASEYGVQGIPTVVGFRQGRAVARFTGALPEPSVRQWLRDLAPTRADELAAAARAALEAGDRDAARSGFEAARELDPTHVEAGVGLARILLDDGEFEAAAAILDELPDRVSPDLRARLRLSNGAGDVADLEAAVADRPGDWEAGLALGRAYAAAGSYPEALERLQEVVESRSDGSEEARLAMLDLFDLLGETSLVSEYRRRLASALF